MDFVETPSGLVVPMNPRRDPESPLGDQGCVVPRDPKPEPTQLGEILACQRWEDIGFAAIAFDTQYDGFNIDVKVYEIEEFDKGITPEEARRLPQEDSRWVAEGDVRWDGCSNWKVYGYAHFCYPGHFFNFAEALNRSFRMAGQLMAKFTEKDYDPTPWRPCPE